MIAKIIPSAIVSEQECERKTVPSSNLHRSVAEALEHRQRGLISPLLQERIDGVEQSLENRLIAHRLSFDTCDLAAGQSGETTRLKHKRHRSRASGNSPSGKPTPEL